MISIRWCAALLAILTLAASNGALTTAADIPIVQSIASDLAYDEHNRLAQHHLVYDASSCHDVDFQSFISKNGAEDHVSVEGVEGYALDHVFGPYPKRDWRPS